MIFPQHPFYIVSLDFFVSVAVWGSEALLLVTSERCSEKYLKNIPAFDLKNFKRENTAYILKTEFSTISKIQLNS